MTITHQLIDYRLINSHQPINFIPFNPSSIYHSPPVSVCHFARGLGQFTQRFQLQELLQMTTIGEDEFFLHKDKGVGDQGSQALAEHYQIWQA